MAFTAALAMAEPPRLPVTVMKGTLTWDLVSASFDSAAPTKPTGVAIIAAGDHLTSFDLFDHFEQGGGRVANHDDRAIGRLTPKLNLRGRSCGAQFMGERRCPVVIEKACRLIGIREKPLGDAGTHHFTIAKNGLALSKRRLPGCHHVAAIGDVFGQIHHPQA